MPLCKIQPSTGAGKERSWEGTGAFGKIKKNPSFSDIRAQSLEQSEEMRSEHRPGEGVGRCFQKKSRDIPAFVLIRSPPGRQARHSSEQRKTIKETSLMRRDLGWFRKL